MKPITEMDYYELSHMSAKEIKKLESWQQAMWCQRIFEFEEKERGLKNGK